MAVDVDICNSALRKIKAAQITSLTDGSTNANACVEAYPRLRDELLELHNWNFAIERVELAKSATSPAFGFTNKFTLPSDWLRTIDVFDDDEGIGRPKFKEESGFLHTDAEQIFLRYVQQVEDVNRMPNVFRETLAFKLAEELAIDLKGSRTLSERMEERGRRREARARTKDAQGDFPEEFNEGSWVTERG